MAPQSIFAATSLRLNSLWADAPLRTKGLLVAAIPLVALLAAALSCQIFQRADREAVVSVDRTAAAANSTRNALVHLLDWESALHEYALTGGAQQFARLEAATKTMDADFSSLETLLRDEPDQLARLHRIRRLYRQESMRAELSSPAGAAAITDALRRELGAMRTGQETLLAIRTAHVMRLRAQESVAIAGAALLGLGGGVFAILLFTSGVARTVERVERNAARLAQRLPLPPHSHGRDELGGLERTLENLCANLRQREEERDRFFALSLDMLCVVTLDGRFRRVNPALTKTLGHPEADLLSSGILDFVHVADREATAARIRELACGNPIVYFENRLCCEDGAYKWLAWSIAPSLAEGVAYAVARDRTRQKLDEQALRQSNARLESVLESITDGFFAVDRAWHLIRVNPQSERLWMRPRQDLLGGNLWEVFPEAADGPFHRLFGQVIDTGAPAHLEKFYPPFNRWLEVHAYPSVEGLSVYFRDVTERRQAEDKIGRALREKEVLLREVHHRVKNNLQVICSMLRLEAGRSHDEKLSQVLRDCRERVMAMAMLHDQLHRAKDLSNINLGEYSRNLAASMFCSYGVNSAQIELRMEVEDIPVPFDTAIPCGLIMHELLSNALRHAFPAGQKGRVWLILRAQTGGRIELTVCDDGRGFSEGAAFAGTRSLGLRLVDLLAEQIDAAVERSSQAGTLCRLLFQVKKSKETKSDEQISDPVG
jgi:PAS domain S-box-containing protein